MTKRTAAPIPTEVETLFETPRKGQIPKNCAKTMLFTRIALMKTRIYPVIFPSYAALLFLMWFTSAIRKPRAMKAPGGMMKRRTLSMFSGIN